MNKRDYYIYQEDLVKINPDKKDVSISEIVKRLNSFCKPGMKKMRTVQITNYMLEKNFLFENEQGSKRPTTKGTILGIRVEERKDEFETIYFVNLYNERAQMYIYDHLYDIIL